MYLHFAGVDSCFYAWLNGKKLGYHEDSRTPAEFDITPQLQEGENLLAVEVYRFGDGAFLEDQDMWRMSGIFRDVYLWSTAPRHVRDFEVHTDLDSAYRDSGLTVHASVTNASSTASKAVLTAELLDASGDAGGPPSGQECRSSGFRRSPGGFIRKCVEPAEVVRGNAVPLQAPADPQRRSRQPVGSDPRQRGIPKGGDPRRPLSDQRPGRPDQRREPSRARREHRQVRADRDHGARHPPHEAVQRECRAHQPLPQRYRLVRSGRSIRPLCPR